MSTVHTSAASLYRAILDAASTAWEDSESVTLEAVRPGDPDEDSSNYCTAEFRGPWLDVKRAMLLEVPMHGPVRPYPAPATFAFQSNGARASFKIKGNRTRLLAMAEQVRKHWALYGGGPVPADLAKPKAVKRAVTWPVSIIKVWLQQFEDKDYAGAMLTGERLDAVFYPGAKGCAFILAAPIQVEGLPDGVCSARRNDGKWVVACMQSGRAIESRGYGSRKTAEESALSEVARVGLDKLTAALERNRADAVDHDEARAAWCKACNIEDPREPAQVAQPAPESEEGAESADDWAARMVAMVAQPVDVAPVATAPDALERSPEPAPVPVAPDAAPVAPVAHAAPPVVQAAGPVVAPSTDSGDFSRRVNMAAAYIGSGRKTSRAFDSCFEMWDGDAVVTALLRRVESRPDTKLAANIWRYLCRSSVEDAAARQPAGLTLAQWSDALVAGHGQPAPAPAAAPAPSAPPVGVSAPPVTVSAGQDAGACSQDAVCLHVAGVIDADIMRSAADRAQVLADGIKAAAGDDPATMARMLKSEAARVKAAALGMPARIAASYRATADMLEYAAELHADALAEVPDMAREARPGMRVQATARRPVMARRGTLAQPWRMVPSVARRIGRQARRGPAQGRAAPRMRPQAAAPPVWVCAAPVGESGLSLQ